MPIVEEQIAGAHKVEGDDEDPKERTDPHREQRQYGQQAGGEIAVGGGRGETGRQVRPDDAGNQEDETEEAEAVQRGDRAMSLHAIHRSELGQAVGPEAEQPRHVAKDELHEEEHSRRHSGLLPKRLGVI